jgi:hypothetical protein
MKDGEGCYLQDHVDQRQPAYQVRKKPERILGLPILVSAEPKKMRTSTKAKI